MSQNEGDKNYEGWEKSPDSSLFLPKSVSQNEGDKIEDSRTGLHKLVLWLYHNKWKFIFWLTASVLALWGVVEIAIWWFDRTIGSYDDPSAIWVFGLGVFFVLIIWNMLD